jgi:cation diffusion facilitator family transporter
LLDRRKLVRFAWLSIAAAFITISLKAGAYLVTGSVGLLSDALESCVNLAGAVIALAALNIAAHPPDADHAYGHDKIEYFSSGIEGVLIFVAALSIAAASINRLLNPQPLEKVGIGLIITLVATLVNLATSRVLLNAGRSYRSIALEADGHHLMTDVSTSVAVVIGVAAVGLTGWWWLDPVIGLFIAANIIFMGVKLVRRSMLGLLDTALPEADLQEIRAILDRYADDGIQTHALRTRQSGARRFISVHVLVPNYWTVSQGHALLERLEGDIRTALPSSTVFTHLEPLNEAASFEDIVLDREPVQPFN